MSDTFTTSQLSTLKAFILAAIEKKLSWPEEQLFPHLFKPVHPFPPSSYQLDGKLVPTIPTDYESSLVKLLLSPNNMAQYGVMAIRPSLKWGIIPEVGPWPVYGYMRLHIICELALERGHPTIFLGCKQSAECIKIVGACFSCQETQGGPYPCTITGEVIMIPTEEDGHTIKLEMAATPATSTQGKTATISESSTGVAMSSINPTSQSSLKRPADRSPNTPDPKKKAKSVKATGKGSSKSSAPGVQPTAGHVTLVTVATPLDKEDAEGGTRPASNANNQIATSMTSSLEGEVTSGTSVQQGRTTAAIVPEPVREGEQANSGQHTTVQNDTMNNVNRIAVHTPQAVSCSKTPSSTAAQTQSDTPPPSSTPATKENKQRRLDLQDQIHNLLALPPPPSALSPSNRSSTPSLATLEEDIGGSGIKAISDLVKSIGTELQSRIVREVEPKIHKAVDQSIDMIIEGAKGRSKEVWRSRFEKISTQYDDQQAALKKENQLLRMKVSDLTSKIGIIDTYEKGTLDLLRKFPSISSHSEELSSKVEGVLGGRMGDGAGASDVTELEAAGKREMSKTDLETRAERILGVLGEVFKQAADTLAKETAEKPNKTTTLPDIHADKVDERLGFRGEVDRLFDQDEENDE